jgi:hypothetical protein
MAQIHTGLRRIAKQMASPKKARRRGEMTRGVARGEFCEAVGRVTTKFFFLLPMENDLKGLLELLLVVMCLIIKKLFDLGT